MPIDPVDEQILNLLSEDARRPQAQIAAEVGLSQSSVTERIKKLVASGTVRRWTIEVDPEAIGRPLLAMVYVYVLKAARSGSFDDAVAPLPDVVECHHVTGEWTYLLKIRSASIHEFETFMLEVLLQIDGVDRTHTQIVLSSSKGR